MHISRDVQGVKIGLDYRVECHTYSLGEACRATPFWINVHGAQPGSSVRAVFINHSQDGNREIREIDLRFDGLKHTAEVTDGTRTRINGGRQELAVVINGVWSTRYTGGRNFSIDLMNGR